MATAWVKSLQCKSSKMAEEVHNPIRRRLIPPIAAPGCGFSVQALKDVIETTAAPAAAAAPRSKPRKKPRSRPPPSPMLQKSASVSHPGPALTGPAHASRSASDLGLPALKELPEGHPSRNVVEIIFHTSWSPKAFPAAIEMVFKIQNAARTVARFEEYREAVKRRAGSASASGEAALAGDESSGRCVADGNEVMRFHCLGPAAGARGYDAEAAFPAGEAKGAAICTFSGSGAAHERGGGGRGRRAMLVCRVVAGRVGRQPGAGSSGCDSVGSDHGELRVFDRRAVLPCFLVIYQL